MRKFLIILIVGAVWLIPHVGQAQEINPTPPAPATANSIDAGKLLAIGVGVVIGSVVLETIAVSRLSGIVGGVVGGMIGNWWYNQSQAGPTINKTRYMETSVYAGEFKPLKTVGLAR